MKTRLGFVTNSSSTSFCLYGVYDDSITSQLRELADKETDGYIDTLIDKRLVGNNACVRYTYLFEMYAIGMDRQKLGDDVTMGEAKQKAIDTIRKAFPEITFENFEWHKEAGSDNC